MNLVKKAQSVEDYSWEDEIKALEDSESIDSVDVLADDDDDKEEEESEIEVSENEENEEEESEEDEKLIIQVDDEEPMVFDFKLSDVPGATIEDVEDSIVVEEPEDEVKVEELDRWNWESAGLGKFLHWLQGMFNTIPGYYGHQTSGVERAMAYLSKLDQSISKAVRSDLREELDIAQVEDARKEIRDGIKRLEKHLSRISMGDKKKKAAESEEYRNKLVKEAQKISGVNRTTITVDILLARVAKVCINGMVSAGHDIEDLFDRQVKKYALNVREQASVMQLLEDMGYPLRRDRGFLLNEEIDTTKSDNFDWAANYNA